MDLFERIARISSLVAIPIVIGVGGWWIQDAVSQGSLRKITSLLQFPYWPNQIGKSSRVAFMGSRPIERQFSVKWIQKRQESYPQASYGCLSRLFHSFSLSRHCLKAIRGELFHEALGS